MLNDNAPQPPPRTFHAHSPSSPYYPTLFVGRSGELVEIQKRLSNPACRLLTLVGPGGIGKTRLAQEVTAQLTAETFSHGIYFVNLQQLASFDLIVSAITEAVQLPFYTDRTPKEHLLSYLQGKALLLLLDNFEHLLSDVSLLTEILNFAPGVKLLITSRTRLNLREEWISEVGSLDLPASEAEFEIQNYSAVQLFVQQAQRVNSGFSLTPTNMADVVHICHIVSGIPLALELAATWLRALTCAEIAKELEIGLNILETTDRNAPERHRSMRAVLDHSWQLLPENEQHILMPLSVFRGGFTSEAAKAVVGATRHTLSALVDKSWLRFDTDLGRYGIHELLRQYGEEKLTETGGTDAVRTTHAEYFGFFMQERERDIKFRRQVAALLDIERDFANIRFAWEWAATTYRHQDIFRMAEALNFFCDMKVRYIEGEDMFRAASEYFASSDNPDIHLTYNRLRARRIRMILLGAQTHLLDHEKLRLEAEAIVHENRDLNNPAELAFSMLAYGLIIYQRSREAVVNPYFEERLDIHQELGDLFYVAESLVSVGTTASYQQALEIERHIGDENGIGWTLLELANCSLNDHQFDESDHYLAEALASQRRRGDVKALWATMMFGGDRARMLGEFEKALGYAEECHQAALTMNIVPFKKSAQARLGFIRILAEKDWQQGKALCLACLSLSIPPGNYHYGIPADIDAAFALTIAAYLEKDSSALHTWFHKVIAYMPRSWEHHSVERLTRLGPAALLLLDNEGSTEQAVEIAARVCSIPQKPGQPVIRWLEKWPLLNRLQTAWEHKLGQAAFSAAWERGTKLDIEETVRLLETDYTQLLRQENASSRQALPDSLTDREREVLGLIAAGLSNRGIASQLVISLGTAKWHVSQIMSKLAAESRTQALARARELNLIP